MSALQGLCQLTITLSAVYSKQWILSHCQSHVKQFRLVRLCASFAQRTLTVKQQALSMDARGYKKQVPPWPCFKETEGDDFVYHVTNDCYKNYTIKSVLDRLKNKEFTESCESSVSDQHMRENRSHRYQATCHPPSTEKTVTIRSACMTDIL